VSFRLDLERKSKIRAPFGKRMNGREADTAIGPRNKSHAAN
jgi:hypothetical protein